jgi:hypothetical protein
MPIQKTPTKTKHDVLSPHRQLNLPTLLTASAIVIHFTLVGMWIFTAAPTTDESAQIACGVATWRTLDTHPKCSDPPLPRLLASLPIWAAGANTSWAMRPEGISNPDWWYARSFADANSAHYTSYVRIARTMNLIWSTLLIFVLWRWSSELYGAWGRLIVVAVWCFDPTGIALTGVVGSAVAPAASGIFASYSFWKYLREPSWQCSLYLGLALGLALATDTNWLVMLVAWPILMIFARINQSPTPIHLASIEEQPSLEPNRTGCGIRSAYPPSMASTGTVRTRRPLFRHFAVVLPVAWLFISGTYGFSKIGRPLSQFSFQSRLFGGNEVSTPDHTAQPIHAARVFGVETSDLPCPVPADLLLCLDARAYKYEQHPYSYLNGEMRRNGWWYYYLYALAIKLPIPALMLALTGIYWSFVAPRSVGRTDEWAMSLPAVLLITYISSQTAFSHSVEEVVPAVPLLFLLSGRLADIGHRQRWVGLATGGLLVWCAVSALAIAPHFMSYFNPLAGGPTKGHTHLLGGNLDSGQDLLLLNRWKNAHASADSMSLAYYGYVNPAVCGVGYGTPPPEPQPGWFAIDVNLMMGYDWDLRSDSARREVSLSPYTYFSRFQPVARAGFSIWIFHITVEDANRVRADMGLLPFEVDSE